MGHDAIALLLDFITREDTDELAPYRIVCKDFAASMDLYVEQLSTHFMYKNMKFKQFKKISIRIPNPSYFLQSAIGSIWVCIADFEKAIPKSIGYMEIADEFNQEIKANELPDNLHTVVFGDSFNQEIKPKALTDKLHRLVFGWEFDQEIKPNTLPDNLHTLHF